MHIISEYHILRAFITLPIIHTYIHNYMYIYIYDLYLYWHPGDQNESEIIRASNWIEKLTRRFHELENRNRPKPVLVLEKHRRDSRLMREFNHRTARIIDYTNEFYRQRARETGQNAPERSEHWMWEIQIE